MSERETPREAATDYNKTLIDNLPCVAMLMRRGTYEVVACNKDAMEVGIKPGMKCYESWKGFKTPCPWCLAREVWVSNVGRNIIVEHNNEARDTYWVPADDELYLHYSFDITMRNEFKRNLETLRESEKRLRILSRRYIELREEERARLSRELHDDLAQRLTALSIEMELLHNDADESEKDHIGRISAYCNEAISRLRLLCRSLRPMLIENIGLAVTLSMLCKDFTSRTGISVDVIFNEDKGIVCSADGMHVYRIVQEALENVRLHSSAGSVKLKCDCTGRGCMIAVTDDGAGFDVNEISESAGMIAMHERAGMMGGRLKIRSVRGGGTEVLLTLPCSGGNR